MTTTQTQTAGQATTQTLRTMLSIGPRTRRYRGGLHVQSEIAERVTTSVTYPGYDNDDTTRLMSLAFAPINAYRKHVLGSRISPTVRRQIVEMTPWQFTALIGDMIDSGVTNMAAAETYFEGMK